MDVIETELAGVLIFEPKRFHDERGFFSETFRSDNYVRHGLRDAFVQDNWSHSRQGVLRGLHLQNPNPQGKLLTVLRGMILDVAVDVRTGSPTFGRHVAVELSESNGRQLFVPRGFAHGFVVLTGPADVHYKCDNVHDPRSEITVRWNDPALGIDWRVNTPLLSARDAAAPLLADAHGLPGYRG